MHMISLAPVLSATLRRVCGWIMLAALAFRVGIELRHHLLNRRHLRGALQDLDEAPALVFAERAGLLDAHDVADAGVVVLVVRLEFVGEAIGTLVDRVLLQRFDGDDDGLLHLVAGDPPDLGLTAMLLALLLGARSGRRRFAAHAFSSSAVGSASASVSTPSASTWAACRSSLM